MNKFFSFFFILTLFVNFSEPFGGSLTHILNLRCTLADSYLKDGFQLYDRLVISPNTVSFYLYAKEAYPEKILKVNETYSVIGFDILKPTRVVIHGFLNSYNSDLNKAMKEVYLNDFDVNLFVVDYSKVSRDTCYKIASSRVGLMGKAIGEFLDQILGDDEAQWENLVIIGHSLGAHTAGVAGRSVKNGRVGRIVGLDPAKPGFESPDVENRLRKDDAEFVECIHTNGNNYGLFDPICSVDFYPNFGVKQRGCNILTRDLCSHSRAWQFFAESLRNVFTANECESIEDIQKNTPCNGSELIMGGDDFEGKKNKTGIFYLKTGKEPPFALG